MKIFKNFVVIFIVFLSSCGALNMKNANKSAGLVRVKQFTDDKGTLLWAHYDPTKRQTIMYINKNSELKILAEQSPDAGFTKIFELIPKFDINDAVTADISLKSQKNLINLTNRTTSIMFAREALYRLSEAGFNGYIDKSEYVVLYKLIINNSLTLMKEEIKSDNEDSTQTKNNN